MYCMFTSRYCWNLQCAFLFLKIWTKSVCSSVDANDGMYCRFMSLLNAILYADLFWNPVTIICYLPLHATLCFNSLFITLLPVNLSAYDTLCSYSLFSWKHYVCNVTTIEQNLPLSIWVSLLAINLSSYATLYSYFLFSSTSIQFAYLSCYIFHYMS